MFYSGAVVVTLLHGQFGHRPCVWQSGVPCRWAEQASERAAHLIEMLITALYAQYAHWPKTIGDRANKAVEPNNEQQYLCRTSLRYSTQKITENVRTLCWLWQVSDMYIIYNIYYACARRWDPRPCQIFLYACVENNEEPRIGPGRQRRSFGHSCVLQQLISDLQFLINIVASCIRICSVPRCVCGARCVTIVSNGCR